MLTFFSDRQTAHAPVRELNNGEWVDFAESTARIDSILGALGKVQPATDYGLEPLLDVHDAKYVDFLKSAHSDWVAQGRSGDAIGYAFPVRGRRPLDHDRIDAKLGQYGFDAASPIASGTWDAAYWSAQSALSAFEALAAGKARQAFALCRPPGHHCGKDYFGGYCYLNNAAIAARQAVKQGLGPVAILDVDYHHGNGTQDIFYDDADVLFVSIHADPKMDYPYYWGHADETGTGVGAGKTVNLPLQRGAGFDSYQYAMMDALNAIKDHGTNFLIVSYGADTFADDPISHFKLSTHDMRLIGLMIGGLGLPTLTVMEGGYCVEALGENVLSFQSGLEDGTPD